MSINPHFPKLFSPGEIHGLKLKNRIVKAPTSSGLSNKDGTVSDRLIRHYRPQAAGGVGLLIVEYAFIDEDASKSAHCQLGINSVDHISGLARLADIIREEGAKPAIQIEHCGRQKFYGVPPIKSASAIPWPYLQQKVGDVAIPKVMDASEIKAVISAFGDAALRAKEAGFELVEIHGAHGYLLTNFLSPHTNKRTDEWGGSLENRMRLTLDVIDDCRSKVGPDFPLTIRLSGSDYEPDGFSVDTTVQVARAAVQHGIDAIHVSGGDHHQMIHQVSPMAVERGHNVWAAEALKAEVEVPVIASGSITLPDQAEQILEEGKADFIGMGRPLWADPDWANKARAGRMGDIRPCIRCNDGCLDRTYMRHQGIQCSVNPNTGHEGRFEIQPAARRKRVAVIGGGVAGMEAARTLKLRGHDVTIFEKRSFLGGVGIEGSAADFKDDLRFFVDYQIRQVEQLGIEVKYGEVTPGSVKDFEDIIVATGGKSARPPIKGIDSLGLVDAVQSFVDDSDIGNSILVLGGGETAVEAALHHEQKHRKVTLIHRGTELMTREVAFTDKIGYGERLEKSTVKVILGEQVCETGTGWVRTETQDGESRQYEADTVIIGMGYVELEDQWTDPSLVNDSCNIHVIGDRLGAAKVYEAVHTGYRTALKI